MFSLAVLTACKGKCLDASSPITNNKIAQTDQMSGDFDFDFFKKIKEQFEQIQIEKIHYKLIKAY